MIYRLFPFLCGFDRLFLFDSCLLNFTSNFMQVAIFNGQTSVFPAIELEELILYIKHIERAIELDYLFYTHCITSFIV